MDYDSAAVDFATCYETMSNFTAFTHPDGTDVLHPQEKAYSRMDIATIMSDVVPDCAKIDKGCIELDLVIECISLLLSYVSAAIDVIAIIGSNRVIYHEPCYRSDLTNV
jgi:hypothetical protein